MTTDVSVIIPCKNPDWRLDLTLESLRHQRTHLSYDVVLVDDHSDPRIEIEAERFPYVQVLRLDEGDPWGRAAGCHFGTTAAEGSLLMWLDSDCIASPVLIQSHWDAHSRNPWSAGVGTLAFADSDTRDAYPDDSDLAAVLSDPEAFQTLLQSLPHEVGTSLQEKIWRQTKGGRERNVDSFRMFTGACGSMPRALYEATGGFDPQLKLGEDTEMAYRLEVEGGVPFLVDSQPTIHIGLPTTSRAISDVRRFNDAFLTQRVPKPMYRADHTQSRWQVPVAVVRIEKLRGLPRDALLTPMVLTVEQILHGERQDVLVDIGDWTSELPETARLDGRTGPLDDSELDAVIFNEWFRGDVRIVRSAPPVPYAFEIAVGLDTNLASSAIAALIGLAESNQHVHINASVCSRHVGASARLYSRHGLNRARALGAGSDGDVSGDAATIGVDGSDIGASCRQCNGGIDASTPSGIVRSVLADTRQARIRKTPI